MFRKIHWLISPPSIFTANLEHLELVTPISRLNIVVESVRVVNQGYSYNAFVSDKDSGKRLFDESDISATVTKSLERLLDYTCLLLETHREDPGEWRKQSALIVGQLGHRSLSQSMTDTERARRLSESGSQSTNESEAEANTVVPTPARGQKRNASAMESDEDSEHLVGSPRLPGTHSDSIGRPTLPPGSDAKSATAQCASLPSTVSVGARELLYELLTRPQVLYSAQGVYLPRIALEISVEHLELEGYLEELEGLGKARNTGWGCWLPAGLTAGSICLTIDAKIKVLNSYQDHQSLARPPFTASRFLLQHPEVSTQRIIFPTWYR